MSNNPFTIFLKNKAVIKQFIKRNINARYRGSYLGILWSLLTPLLMLTVYTFVFSVVFEAKWGGDSNSKVEFALVLFCGLIIYNIFSEVLIGSTSVILQNVNLVKKVVFPLEIFPIVILGSSIFHALISMVVLIFGVAIFMGSLNWTIIFIPLVLLPIFLLSIGIGWILSSLGVYLRDIGQIIGIFMTALMFLSPIFYSVQSIPEKLRFLFFLNPLSYAIENLRAVIIWGNIPDFTSISIVTIIGIIVMYIGYYWFNKTRKGFSDVV